MRTNPNLTSARGATVLVLPFCLRSMSLERLQCSHRGQHLPVPVGKNLVLHEHFDNVMVGGQQLVERAFPLDLVFPLSTRTNRRVVADVVGCLPGLGFHGCRPLHDGSCLACSGYNWIGSLSHGVQKLATSTARVLENHSAAI